MAVEHRSLTQRKKKRFKTKLQRLNNEKFKPKEGSKVGTINLNSYFVYFGYIIASLAVISSLSWLILCKAFCNELEICSPEFLTSFGQSKANLNDAKESLNLQPQPRVPKEDASLWVLDRRSNLSLSEFIEKYDGKR